jgi:hypothetical protein
MSRATIGRLVFFGLLALLMLAELFFSNIGSLGRLEAVAAQLGLTPAAERTRLFILIILDAVGGIGAIICVTALLGNRSLARTGLPLTVFGFVAYGLYQIVSALTQLAAQWRMPITIVGIVYILIGLAAWQVGRGMLRQKS